MPVQHQSTRLPIFRLVCWSTGKPLGDLLHNPRLVPDYVVIALNGVGPFIWIPLANVYGRRPICLLTTVIGFASALGSAYSKNFTQIIVARVFNGLWPAALGLGPATVVDLFFYHQRGRGMGLFTVILTTRTHIAPIVGGLISQFLGWR